MSVQSGEELLAVINKVRAQIQGNVPAIRASELGTVNGDIRLRGEKIIRDLFELNSRVHEREVAIPAK